MNIAVAKPVRNLCLRSLMSGPDGWGTAEGRRIGQLARFRIDAAPGRDVVRISLDGVARLDVTFAQEALVAPIRDHLVKRGLCVANPRDGDVAANVVAAAEQMGVPVTLWSGATVQTVGLAVRAGSRVVIDYALQRPQTCTREVAAALGLSVSNVSARLKELWEIGYLMRDEVASTSGGGEFVYSRIG